jgi:peptidyl-prolyl cis-trans isomerase SDCCAG10
MYSTHQKEPPTNGKVILNTTVGPVDIELWSKEAPKAARNFVQLCLDGFYDNCNFFRVIPGFIAQTGDRSNTGTGPQYTYLPNNEAFPQEIHSRLHFSRRGIVACAGTPNDPSVNANQFFVTLDKAPELEKKHSIFGKVVGDSIFNLITINEMELEKGFEDRLCDPPVILSTSVVWNPFDDLFPRLIESRSTETAAKIVKEKPQSAAKAIKSFAHLSFGDEAEQDEEAFSAIREKVTFAPSRTKSKPTSSHPSAVTDSEKESPSASKFSKLSSPAADEDLEWQRQLDEKAKAWKKAERKAEARDERREQRLMEKKRRLAGKTESDSDEPDFDEDGNPTYRKRKNGELEDIVAPKFKKSKTVEEESDDLHSYQKSAPVAERSTSRAPAPSAAPSKKAFKSASGGEDSILAKLAAFKSKIKSDGSATKKSEEDDWKQGALVFDPSLEREGDDKRDMQRDDYVVYDPAEEKRGHAQSSDRGSLHDDRDRQRSEYRRDDSYGSSRGRDRASPPRRNDDRLHSAQYDAPPTHDSRYDRSPPRRAYRDSSPTRSQRHYASEHSESRDREHFSKRRASPVRSHRADHSPPYRPR